MISLDRDSPQPLSDQIVARLAELIAERRLPPGARLASIRQMASDLAVSPQTVVTAYDRLVASGRIASRGTAGFFVRTAETSAPEPELLEAGDEHEPVWLAQQANDQRAGRVLAGGGGLPASWLQDAIPAAAVQRALAGSSAGMAARCPPQGLPELRERIAMLMRGQGIAVDAGRVMTTYGATQAIDLICRAFLKPGDTVLVEDPGYFLMFGRLGREGYRIVPITRRVDGLDLAELEEACRTQRPRLLFVQSVLHNPTGWGSSPANLHRLLNLAQQYGFLIAEDDVHGHFHPGQPTRLAALATLGSQIIYFSSFCKALSPALRLGYLAADPLLLKPLLREKIVTVLTTPALNEMVLLEALASGRWRKHLERLQRRLLAARNASMRQLGEAGMAFDAVGEGGLFLWGRLPAGVDAELLAQDALRHGFVLAPGSSFSAERRPSPQLRFNVVLSQHVGLAAYLRERLQQLGDVRELLAAKIVR